MRFTQGKFESKVGFNNLFITLGLGENTMAKHIELWDDDNQNQIWGELTDDNKVELRADINGVIVGELQGNKLDLAPHSQDHIWGFVNGNEIELWDDQLHHFSGEVT